MCWKTLLKFMYSEKSTKIGKIFLLVWSYLILWEGHTISNMFRRSVKSKQNHCSFFITFNYNIIPEKILWPSQKIWTLKDHPYFYYSAPYLFHVSLMNSLNDVFIYIGSKILDKKLCRENAWGISMRFQPDYCPIMKYLVGAT